MVFYIKDTKPFNLLAHHFNHNRKNYKNLKSSVLLGSKLCLKTKFLAGIRYPGDVVVVVPPNPEKMN